MLICAVEASSFRISIRLSYLVLHLDLDYLRGLAIQVILDHLDHLGHLSGVHVEIALQIKQCYCI